MTAEIVVYNKNAVALAADSAVTVYGSKTYNSANKLFMLSKYQPVGILVYNSATVNGIPVELIIKEYRKQLNKNCFATIREYKDDFIKFLKNFVLAQLTDAEKQISILTQLNNFFTYITERSDVPQTQQGQDFFEEFNKYLDSVFEEVIAAKIQKEDVDYTIVDLAKELENIFITRTKIQNISATTIAKLLNIFPYYIDIPYNPSSTGFAICGYGDAEFMPTVYCFETLGFINNLFKITEKQNNEASSNGIIPLAQRDMTDLFVKGIDSHVYNFIVEQYNDFIDDLVTKMPNIDPMFARYIRINKGAISNKVDNILHETKVSPLLNVISILSKDELAELSESLVNLQALKHKMSLNMETVGGPIDVAIISKHDGFIWKKRKLYFDKNLNRHFFENYFSKDDVCDNINEEEK